MIGKRSSVNALTACGGQTRMSSALEGGRMKACIFSLALCAIVSTLAIAAPSDTIDTVPAAGTYAVNNDRVNVRAAPDVAKGLVVAKLNKGAKVEVIEMTVLTYAVQDMRAAWFRIQEPDGWVYGYYLDPSE